MGFSLSRGRDLDVTGVGFAPEDLPPLSSGPIDLREWFEPQRRAHPLELEIGSGKGTFIVNQATAVPGVNLIGLEYARAFWRYAADRARRHGLANVKLVNIEAGVFLRNYAPDACFAQIHIYFPDPWPKKRHHKRRLIQEPFLRLAHQKLQPAGLIRIATDHDEYFVSMQEQVAKVSDVFERLEFEAPGSGGQGELVGSNFERKYRREGRRFSAMMLRKR